MEGRINELHRTVDSPYMQDVREVEMKLHIYLDEEPLVVDRENYLMNLELLEELSTSEDTPIGSITANELSVQLFNEEAIFDPGNNESPFYGKIATNVPIEVYIRENFNSTDWLLLGTYYVSDWQTNTETMIVDITAYDELYHLLGRQLPVHPIYRDITVADFLTNLLLSVGITKKNLLIDAKLSTYTMAYAYPAEGSLRETLQPLSEAFLFYFYQDRLGRFCAKHLSSVSAEILPWDADFVYSAECTKSLLRSYSGVNVVYEEKAESEVQELAKIEDASMPRGVTDFTGVLPSTGPVFNLEYVKFDYTTPLNVTRLLYNAWQLGVSIENPNKDVVTASFSVYGSYLQTVTSTVVKATDATMVGRIGERLLSISNPYIGSKDQAERISKTLLAYQMADDSLLEVSHRGNPQIALGDTIELQLTNTPKNYMVISQGLSYDGSLTGKSKLVFAGMGGYRDAL